MSSGKLSLVFVSILIFTTHSQLQIPLINPPSIFESSMAKLTKLSIRDLYQLLNQVDASMSSRPSLYNFYKTEIVEVIKARRIAELKNQNRQNNASQKSQSVEKVMRRIYGRNEFRVPYFTIKTIDFYFFVDLTAQKLTKKPIFVNTFITTEEGRNHWDAIGVSSIYNLSNKGFQVYIQLSNGVGAYKVANDNNWQLFYEIVVDE